MTSNDGDLTILPNARLTPRFAGIASFCRFPRIEEVPASHRPIDWALYGIPFDGGVTYQPGARFGPRAIREASQYIKPVHQELGVNIARAFSMADAGDAPVQPFDCRATLDFAVDFAAGIGESANTRLFAVGGDHSIAYANIRATWERRGKPAGGLALLHFDAHLDTADVVWGEKWTHASPFIRGIEDGLIDPSAMLSVGIRGPLNTATDLDYGREKGIEIVTFEQWRTGDGQARIDAFLQRLGDREVYVTFDIDSVDPAFAPGTGTPCCGGFTSAEALGLLRGCAGANIVGADLVEVLPARDPAGTTALLAAHVIFEILAVAAARQH
ncbi:MAG: agmatinase [Planctomycetota bacterium]|jgi:agmatinase